ncbi:MULTISPECIES: hypothetical protein [Sphingobacterium]|uniref:hypothetical protein n=1 Tax=Sphingobacterium TaxID=28453 RepID=UPI0013DACEFC|nr:MULTISPECIES: hypothetical protein [unclassified Sphingobacterium]
MKAISYIKKNSMLLLAGAAVISFSSFKAVEKYLQTSYYWFEYDASGHIINQDTMPDPSATNPYACEGDEEKCAQAYTSVTLLASGKYAPGTPALENGQEVVRFRN